MFSAMWAVIRASCVPGTMRAEMRCGNVCKAGAGASTGNKTLFFVYQTVFSAPAHYGVQAVPGGNRQLQVHDEQQATGRPWVEPRTQDAMVQGRLLELLGHKSSPTWACNNRSCIFQSSRCWLLCDGPLCSSLLSSNLGLPTGHYHHLV